MAMLSTVPQNRFMVALRSIYAVDLAWHDRAACADADRALFFPTTGAKASPAIAICHRCPARQECLAWALEHEHHGIWGGYTQRALARIRRRRQGRTWAALAAEELSRPIAYLEDRH